ncbi:MAG TPA: amidase [Candidatus Dormibacteraeota bacterium]
MPVRTPSLEQLSEIALEYGLDLSEADLASFQGLVAGALASYARLDQLAEPALPVRYPRTPGHRPAPEENPLNAWYWRCSIRGAVQGPLAGKRVAIKDNVAVAGVPMMNGSSVLEGYVPEGDATVVTRILDAGGEIVGKAVCEHLCFSGSSFTSDTGPVHNPHDPAFSAGGSSSGSAALVVAGECDMAIGGDQGGSVRIPASWCGAYGLKPTYGLVPYTGAFPIELTLDHLGPMAATVRDVALLLEAIAGEDGLDPRQRGVRVDRYVDALGRGAEGLRIGVVPEGFGWDGLTQPDVDEAVRAAAERFAAAGATVRELAVPMHRDGIHIWNGIATEGATMLMVRGNGMGTNWKGHYSTSLLDAYARGRLTRGDDLSDTVKLVVLAGQYLQDAYHGRYYAKAQNLARSLSAAYDAALSEVDLLLMPTIPTKATRIPAPDAPREERMARALEMIPNTAPFDVTGHPAMNVPCARSEGLPVGLMLVGRQWEDGTVLRAAHAFEALGDYSVRPEPVGASSR